MVYGLIGATVYIAAIGALAVFVPYQISPNIMFKPRSDGFMLTRFREADTTRNAEILILGSSHAYRGFDPRIFGKHGLKIFNLGSSSQTPLQSKVLLDYYFESFEPSVVVFEVFPSTFSSDGSESAIDLISFHEADYSLFQMSLSVGTVVSINSFAYSFFKGLTQPVSMLAEPLRTPSDMYVQGGYVEKIRYQYEDQVFFKSHTLVFLDKQMQAFEEILSLLSKHGKRIILVQAPVTKAWHDSIANLDEIDAYFKNMTTKFPSVEYYDYSQLIREKEKEFFFDSHHLNQKGVAVFNRVFLDAVFSMKHREDSGH